nr:hypothetical protein [Streptomyces sp. CB00455]
MEPVLGAVNLTEISPPLVRSWRADKLAGGTGPTTVAKAYVGQGGDSSAEPLQPAVAQGVPEGRDQGASFP